MISGFEKYHRLIDFQYIFMDLLRDYFILKLYYLFSQNLESMLLSSFVGPLADFIGLKWRLFTTFALCLFLL